MLSFKSILYISLLLTGMFGSVAYHPLIGIIGYILTYNVNPVGYWWGASLPSLGIRSSLFLAIATGIGMIIHRSKLKLKISLGMQETLLLIFLGLILLSIPLGLGFNEGESNALKMIKVVIIILMASHIITDLKKYEMTVWTLIIAGLVLAVEIYNAPGSMFRQGRFNVGIGGSDFSDGNFLGAHFAMVLPLIGIMFLKGGWKSRIVCLISGVFVANSIILCRSRGVFLGILAGLISAVIFSVPRKRLVISFGICVAIVGGLYLSDPGYLKRMGDIAIEKSQLDDSSRGRVLAWEAAFEMVSRYPLGIGEGNFKKYVGDYNPRIPGKDTHNTFLRCLAELGIGGLLVYLLLIGNAFRILHKIGKQAKTIKNSMNFIWHIYGIRVSLIIFITCGLTMTHTYIEELYWLLCFPIFLEKSVKNWSERNI